MSSIRAKEALFSARRHVLRAALTAIGSMAVAGTTGLFFGPGFRGRKSRPRTGIPGTLLGGGAATGHLLRGGARFPAPSDFRDTEVAIVGGGISGLSAAWALGRHGVEDYLLLELESDAGGNSRGGKNSISAYPWAAHYVPIPGEEATLVRELFEELGIITGHDPVTGLPIYDEFFLCADPHERLLIHGTWQEGLVPHIGLSEPERAEVRRFFSAMEEFKAARGRDGRPAFAIPLDKSSRDPSFTRLDRISMADFLARNGFGASPLKWYVNYCCRDDYGTEMTEVSAWAGIHYFASRRGKAANADSQTVVTWPEGNAWIAERLKAKAGNRVHGNALVFNIEKAEQGAIVDSFDPRSNRTTRTHARAVIFAAPRFTAARVLKDFREKPPAYLKAFTYAPWMVANVSLSSLPRGPGAEPAWDNVSYHSPSLGYITATHQSLSLHPTKTVLTYYLPLSDQTPALARQGALTRTHDDWSQQIAADLERMHPGISSEIESIDVSLFGHGMIRPRPGFIWGDERSRAMTRHGNVFFAHSDMSGISIFEEAQYQGARAAEEAARALGLGKPKGKRA